MSTAEPTFTVGQMTLIEDRFGKMLDDRFRQLDQTLTERARAHDREHAMNHDAAQRERALVDSQIGQVNVKLDLLTKQVTDLTTTVAEMRAGRLSLYAAISCISATVGVLVGWAVRFLG